MRFARPKPNPQVRESRPHVAICSAENTIFESNKKLSVGVFPIPDWLKDPKCSSCSELAKYLLLDTSPICSVCLGKILVGANIKMRIADTSIPITMDVVSHSRFEWSTDGEKWYSIWGKNLKPDKPDLFIIEMRQAILANKPIIVECDYEKENKTMRIY